MTQIERIKRKLLEAKKADHSLKVFGASNHQYEVHAPATPEQVAELEKQYAIELPSCYKAFVLHIGNGGIGWGDSAAGPFYGIYPLGGNLDELANAESFLRQGCVIFPKMTDEEWEALTKHINTEEEMPDDVFDHEIGKLWAGILPIGTQGCSYLHGIILNGPHRGRVVNLDMDRQKPLFAFESNFLDWYERWLDEVISGDLIKDGPSWFGYSKGGTEDELWASYLSSIEEQNDSLNGLLNKSRLSPHITQQIEQQLKSAHHKALLQLLCKSDYEKAKPFLQKLAPSDLLMVCQMVFWYAKDKSHEWASAIESQLLQVEDEETLRFCTYILEEAGVDMGPQMAILSKHNKGGIRAQAFYRLGQLKDKKDYISCFIDGLRDDSNEVIHAALQALSGIKDQQLLPHYKYLAEKFPLEQDYILANLNLRLAEYGLNNERILKQL